MALAIFQEASHLRLVDGFSRSSLMVPWNALQDRCTVVVCVFGTEVRRPTQVTLGEHGEWQKCLALLGTTGDTVCYNACISACERSSQWEAALMLFDQMLQMDICDAEPWPIGQSRPKMAVHTLRIYYDEMCERLKYCGHLSRIKSHVPDRFVQFVGYRPVTGSSESTWAESMRSVSPLSSPQCPEVSHLAASRHDHFGSSTQVLYPKQSQRSFESIDYMDPFPGLATKFQRLWQLPLATFAKMARRSKIKGVDWTP